MRIWEEGIFSREEWEDEQDEDAIVRLVKGWG